MSTMVGLLRIGNLMASALVAGGQMFCLVAIIPALKFFPRTTSARFHQAGLTHLPEDYLRPAAITSVISAALIMVLKRNHETFSGMMNILGLISQVGNGFISARWEWPINNEVNTWPLEGGGEAPEKYDEMRASWDQHHLWRTCVTLFAMFCFILATLTSEDD